MTRCLFECQLILSHDAFFGHFYLLAHQKNLIFVYFILLCNFTQQSFDLWSLYLQILSIRITVVSTCELASFFRKQFHHLSLVMFKFCFHLEVYVLAHLFGFGVLFFYFAELCILSCSSCIPTPEKFLYINFLSVIILPCKTVLTPCLFFVGASTFFWCLPYLILINNIYFLSGCLLLLLNIWVVLMHLN